MLNFMIVVDDNGELKSISRAELAEVMPTDPDGMPALDEVISMILDQRVLAEPSEMDLVEIDTSEGYVDPTDFTHDDEIEENLRELRGQTDGQ